MLRKHFQTFTRLHLVRSNLAATSWELAEKNKMMLNVLSITHAHTFNWPGLIDPGFPAVLVHVWDDIQQEKYKYIFKISIEELQGVMDASVNQSTI